MRAAGGLGRYQLACVHSLALMVILLGFDNGRTGRMATHDQRHAAPSWCGELPGVRASAAAAGRWVPCGRVAPAFCCMHQLCRRSRICGHAPPGARRAGRAPWNHREILTDPADTRRRQAHCHPSVLARRFVRSSSCHRCQGSGVPRMSASVLIEAVEAEGFGGVV